MYRVYLDLTVRDKTGKVIQKLRRESKSFVKNFMNILHSILTGNDITVVDMNGTTHTIPYAFKDVDNYLETSFTYGSETDDEGGIIVGSGTASPTPDDYCLGNKIPHGDADGQLHYKDTVVGSVIVSGNEITIEITREFNNNGSVSVTVAEVGLVIHIEYKKGGTYIKSNILIIRDVLDSTINVPAGGSLEVKYIIKVVT